VGWAGIVGINMAGFFARAIVRKRRPDTGFPYDSVSKARGNFFIKIPWKSNENLEKVKRRHIGQIKKI